jgi:hypothetical protein
MKGINIGRLTKAFVKTVSKNKSTILTVVGLAGLGATVYTTAKVAPKAEKSVNEARLAKFQARMAKEDIRIIGADEELEDADFEDLEAGKAIKEEAYREEKLTALEYIKAGWKYYLAIIGVTGLTAAAIIFAHYIDAKMIAGLSVGMAAYKDKADAWAEEAKKKLGVDEYKEAKEDIANEIAEKANISDGDLKDDEVWIFDIATNRPFKSTLLKLKEGMLDNRDIMQTEGKIDWARFCANISEDEVHAKADEYFFTQDRNRGLEYVLEEQKGFEKRYILEYDEPEHYKILGISRY